MVDEETIPKPVYSHKPNESIPLGTEDIEITLETEEKTKQLTAKGDVVVRFLPTPNVRVSCQFSSSDVGLINLATHDPKNVQLHFPNRGIKGDCLILKSNITSHSNPPRTSGSLEFSFKKEPPDFYCGADQQKISHVIFHLVNFPVFFGGPARTHTDGETRSAIWFFKLQGGGWEIEISHMPESKVAFERLEETGGYAITHVGCLRKQGGVRFSGKEAEESLQMVRYFLSFARGAWVSPILSVGFDFEGNRVWEQWNSPFGEPWGRGLRSWFDTHHSEQLTGSFSGFAERWQDDNWKKAIRESISWYVNANSSPIFLDARIILTQTAIERLSYEYTVESKRLVEKEGFKKLRASDKFRILFSSLGLSINIPNQLADFREEAKKKNWLDAPHALTEIRNSIVHPEHKRRGQFSSILPDAWKLGLWYLELTILRLLDYSGTYSNRLVQGGWAGNVENVPWAK